MKRKNQNSLFLIEIILSIFIFACTAAICIQIFVNAYQLNKKANYQNFALNQCQNISETWIGTSSSLEDTLDFLFQNHSTTLYYDDQLQVVAKPSPNSITIFSSENQLDFDVYYHDELVDRYQIKRPNLKVKEE